MNFFDVIFAFIGAVGNFMSGLLGWATLIGIVVGIIAAIRRRPRPVMPGPSPEARFEAELRDALRSGRLDGEIERAIQRNESRRHG